MRGGGVVLVALCLLAGPSLAAKKFSLIVGYLPSIKGDDGSRQGLSISGALSLALEEINNSTDILPEVELKVEWNDTRSDTVIATRLLTDMSCAGVVAFFGPEGRCDTEAVIAQARNLPMISYRCPDKLTSPKPNLARLEPPNTMAAKSVISLLRYYRWHKFSILYEEPWVNVALTLENHAKKNNMTVNHQRMVIDGYKCCQDNLACCAPGFWFQFIQDTKNRTRIYVFLGSTTGLVEMMTAMESLQLFVKGEYMVIFVDMMTYSTKDALKYLYKTEERGKGPQQPLRCPVTTELRKRAQSLLVVVSSKPASGYEEFTDKVAKYNALKPFEFSIPPVIKETKFAKFVSIYAAYLYDSVKLYSKALDKLIREDLKSEPLTNEKLRSVATNGSRIVAKMIASSPYKSISGMSIRLDSRADSEGNFSVLAFKPTNFSDEDLNCSCCYSMLPVGHFQQTNKEFPEYKLNRLPIDWPDSVKPEDEPSCGFENEKCPKDDSQITSLVVAGTLAVALFCALVVTASIYRRWKIDQEIEGLLWKIDPNDVGLMGGGLVWSPSKLSLASGMSLESRCCPQIFAETAQYKGNVVRMKELKFSKKKDISRDVMKEMRLLRELRHDNLNSFIGAVVEPLRVCLLSDYCAKGSLYDIIENEDIKLDKMFISSLVHDLIKGMMFIHTSPLQYHGNLKSSNCVVTTRWMLQVSDFGLHELRYCAENEYIGEHQYYRGLLWKSPELLRQLDDPNGTVGGTQKGDVYAFAIIMYELIGRRGPFGLTSLEPKDIVERVKRPKSDNEELFRPDTSALEGVLEPTDDFVVACMRDCWAEEPAARPDFPTVRSRLKKMRAGKSRNVMDQMMDMLEKYANNLEELVNERTRLLNEEKQKTEDLLHRMLPKSVAERLTTGEGVEPESFDSVTIYFSDIVGFTAMSAESSPLQVVNFLNDLYTVFDRVIRGYDVYKVETIGDAYMVVSGLPIRNNERHVGEIASMALELLSAARAHRISHRPTEPLKLRIGIHTGAVVAGVVGLTMPRYCLFGDTVNTASRMESTGEPLKIHISPSCKEALDRIGGYVVESRGAIPIKGKGEITTYWLTGATAAAVQKRTVDSDERPLFCRPRRSPRLTDSRQPSLTDPSDQRSDMVWPGGGGGGSTVRQRLASVPVSCGSSKDERGSRASLPGARAPPDSRASLPGARASPDSRASLPGARASPDSRASLPGARASPDSRASLPGARASPDSRGSLPGARASPDSRASLPGARASPVLRRRTDLGRAKQALSTIASSTACCSLAESRPRGTCAGAALRTQSLDVLPRAAPAPAPPGRPAPLPTVCSRTPFNGTICALLADDFKGEGSPLLRENSDRLERPKKKQDASYIEFYKKWRSLENVDEDKSDARRKTPRLALGSWLLGLFGGGGSRGGSDVSLRRAQPPLLNTESVV